MTPQTFRTVIQVFGAILFAALLGLMVWSLSRPPVLTGPMPDPWGSEHR